MNKSTIKTRMMNYTISFRISKKLHKYIKNIETIKGAVAE